MFMQPYMDEDNGANFGGFIEEDKTDEKPSDEVEVIEEVKEPETEEFDEITYYKEPVKLSQKDRTKYLQLGYHLEQKVQGKLTEYEKEVQRMETFAKGRGYQSFSELEEAQKQLELEQEAEKVADQNPGMTTETAKRLIELERKDKEREAETQRNKITSIRTTQRDSLKSDPLFNEIDALVEATLLQPTMTNETYENVYNYIAGTPQFRSRIVAENSKKLEDERKLTEKRVIANIHDKKSRGISDSSDSVADDEIIEMTAAEKKMSMAFGNDPNEIAKYVKKTKK